MTKAAELAKLGEVMTNSQISGRRNIVTNSTMQIAQRGSSTATGVTAGYHSIDQFRTQGSGNIGQYTISQSTDCPSGIANSMKIDVTTADTSISAGDHFGIGQHIESYNLAQVKKGTSDAKPLTLSFYVKSNVQKQFVVELTDSGNSRHINFQKTVSAINTWERMIVNIPADTSGGFGSGTGKGAELNFWLSAGTTYTSGSAQNTWASRSAANIAPGVANIADSTSNEFFITGIQLEIGNFPNGTTLEQRTFAEELALCQRYYYPAQNFYGGIINASNTTLIRQYNTFPVQMRTTPTVVLGAITSGWSLSTVAIQSQGHSVEYSASARTDFRPAITNQVYGAEL